MEVLFGNTTKRKNSTYVPTVGDSLGDCLLKSPVSIITPIFTVYSNDYPDYNYCFVQQFHRYYFIDDIIATSIDQWDIYCTVDVLATYKTGILNTTAFIERSASLYDPAIPDTAISTTMRCKAINNAAFGTPVFDTSGQGSYILTIAGKNQAPGAVGFAQPFVLQASELGPICEAFFDETKMKALKEVMDDPTNCIVSCIWVPFARSYIQGTAIPIYFATASSGMFGSIALKEYKSSVEIPLECPYFTENPTTHVKNYADYRNCSPYITTELLLPGVGLVEIDTNVLMGTGSDRFKIVVDYSVSPADGDVVYTIRDWVNDGQIIKVVSGNCAVQLPVASSGANYIGKKAAVLSSISGGASLALGAASIAMGHLGGAASIGYGLSTINNSITNYQYANQHTTTVSGNLGGFAGQELNALGIIVFQKQYELSGSSSAIGRPYYNTAQLRKCSGYVKCSGAYIGVQATDQEHNMLISLINGGFYIE